MKSLLSWFRKYRKVILQAVIFLTAIALVVYIFPREGKFRYEYQKGRPWMHEVLIAPYNFPVYKSDAELNRERDSVLSNTLPYFRMDTTILQTKEEEVLRQFALKWEEKASEGAFLSSFREDVRSELLADIRRIYTRGIMEQGEFSQFVTELAEGIILVRGQVATEVDVEGLLTEKNAYEQLTEEVRSLGERYAERGYGAVAQLLDELPMYDFVEPNLGYDLQTTENVRATRLEEISLTRGMVQKGELIVSRGEVVSARKYQILESLRKEYENQLGERQSLIIILGQLILIAACFLVLYLFLYHFRPEVLEKLPQTVFVVILVLIFIFLSRWLVMMPQWSIYLIPVTILPILVRTFFDARLALFIHLVTIMLIGFLAPNPYEFILLSFITGIIALFTLTNVYRRGRLFISSISVIITYSLVYFGFGVIKEGNTSSLDWINFAWFAGNGFLTLLAFPLTFLFEKAFGFLSDATLFELSDTNQPLLRKMAEKAPGTFQHSMQVANLAEEAGRAIDANPLLIRAGALYHDIGKIEKYEYFTENQSQGFNPHNKLEAEESAELIISHIKKGVELARKNNLPQQIIDFIRTHQGTTGVSFFIHKYKEAHDGQEPDLNVFSYPGPIPFTRETAVLMMADGVEAASRSLPEYSEASISALVNRMIDKLMAEGQLNDAPISLKEIARVKEVFIGRLKTIYHARIAYPTEEAKEEKKEETKEEGKA